MKAVSALLQRAESVGLSLWVEGGQLRYRAKQPIGEGLKAQIRERKDDIINLLSKSHGGTAEAIRAALPSWCNTRCDCYHRLEVPDVGTLQWCCQEIDENHWRRDRLDTMSGCPLAGKKI